MSSQTEFRSKIGLIAATVGSAVGLGNIWRFPAEAQAGGGAAFLLVYVLCVCLLGIPVMLAEFSLGRATRTDAIGAFRKLSPGRAPWWTVGALSVLTSFLILIFYMVVAGWTFEYTWQSITGELYEPIEGVSAAMANSQFHARMQQFTQGNSGPLINTIVVILINLGILLAGVTKGIERLSNILMPLLFVLLVVFCSVSLMLENSQEGLRYFLYPDFSKLTPGTCLKALGQAFFSLSLGMGILITYASYFPASTKMMRTAVTVSSLDLLVAVLMGIIVFPAITSFGLQGEELGGTGLVFVTLPEVFQQIPGTRIWSSLFFMLLTIAALTSTISIAEVSIRSLMDRMHWSRTRACFTLMAPLLVLSSLCALSMGALDHLRLFDMNMFSLLDYVTANIMLPVAALGLCIFVGWIAPKNLLNDELTNYGTFGTRFYRIVLWCIRYMAPVLILMVLVSSLI
jgi:NSS family neurotransmitter:Na+ symporter